MKYLSGRIFIIEVPVNFPLILNHQIHPVLLPKQAQFKKPFFRVRSSIPRLEPIHFTSIQTTSLPRSSSPAIDARSPWPSHHHTARLPRRSPKFSFNTHHPPKQPTQLSRSTDTSPSSSASSTHSSTSYERTPSPRLI